MEWWQVNLDEELSEEQLQAKRTDYYNTFFGSEKGRRVLLDIQKMSFLNKGPESTLGRIELYNDIRANCGANIESDKAAIDAEAAAIR